MASYSMLDLLLKTNLLEFVLQLLMTSYIINERDMTRDSRNDLIIS